LALLALNDHVFKTGQLLPSWMTGKLSDFAGMIVAPALFALVVRARTERALVFCHVAVGVVFSAIQLSPGFAAVWSAAMGLLGSPWTIVCDVTDLTALPALWISWKVLVPIMRRAPRGWLRRGSERLLAALGLLFCLATSKQEEAPPEPSEPGCIDNDGDGVCADSDCDDTDASLDLSCCIDEDADGICAAFDCDDWNPAIWESCELACTQSAMIAAGTVVGDTQVGLDELDTGCGGLGPEVPYGYVVAGPSDELQLVTATVSADRPHVLAARSICADPTSELLCRADGEVEILAAPGMTLWLVVEALDAEDAGPFELTVSQAPIVCGDGQVVGPEECDDGNLEPDDGCDAECFLEEAP
jgi:cysteine-rich repeat protein